MIVNQCYSSIDRIKSSLADNVRVEGYGSKRQDVSNELCCRSEGSGAADLPVDVAWVTAIDEEDLSCSSGCESGAELEDEQGIGITLSV